MGMNLSLPWSSFSILPPGYAVRIPTPGDLNNVCPLLTRFQPQTKVQLYQSSAVSSSALLTGWVRGSRSMGDPEQAHCEGVTQHGCWLPHSLTDGAPSSSLLQQTYSVTSCHPPCAIGWNCILVTGRWGGRGESWWGSSDPLHPLFYARMSPVNRHSWSDEGETVSRRGWYSTVVLSGGALRIGTARGNS